MWDLVSTPQNRHYVACFRQMLQGSYRCIFFVLEFIQCGYRSEFDLTKAVLVAPCAASPLTSYSRFRVTPAESLESARSKRRVTIFCVRNLFALVLALRQQSQTRTAS
jgi:hypothetical protein